MAGLLALALVAGCKTFYVAPSRPLALAPIVFPIDTISFPSGLRVIVEQDTRTPLAGIFLLVGSGSTSDPAGKEGLAHFVEHLSFRSRPTGAAPLSELLDSSGAVSHNAMTNFDSTTYYELGLASDVPQMLRLEASRMLSPVLNVAPAELETERAVVVNELRLRNETGFSGGVLEKLQAELFPAGHPYARAVSGTHDSLAKLGASDVQAFVASNYRPDNMTLLILGNVDLDAMPKIVEDALPVALKKGDAVPLPQRMAASPPPVPDAPPASAELPSMAAEVASPELWIAWSVPRAFGTDAHLLAFLAASARRRLVHAVIDDKDIVAVGTQIVPGVQSSMLICRATLQKGEHPAQSRDRLLKEVAHVWGTQGVWYGPRAEVAFGLEREAAVLGEIRRSQSLISRGLERVTSAHFAGSATRYSEVIPALLAMRQQQLHDFANPYFTAERARSLLVTPIAGAAPAPVVLAADGEHGGEQELAGEPVSASTAGDAGKRLALLLPAPARTVYRLPNGLQVVLEPRAGLPLVSAGILFPSAVNDAGESVAELALAIAGRTGRMLNASPASFGASINQQPGPDHLTYLLDGASGNLEGIVADLAEYVQALTIDRAGWNSVQQYLVPQLERSEREPAVLATRRLNASLFGGSTYGNAAGSAEVKAASRGGANQWIERTLVPENAVLVLAGDFHEERAKELIQLAFAKWTGPTLPAPSPAPPRVSSGEAFDVQVTHQPGATQAQLALGCLLPASDDGAAVALHELGAHILEERLRRELRERMGATYGMTVTAISLRGGAAAMFVSGAVENGKLGFVVSRLKQVLSDLAAAPVAPDELARAEIARGQAHALARMTNRGLVLEALEPGRLGFPLEGMDAATTLSQASPELVQAQFRGCASSTPRLTVIGDEAIVHASIQ